MRRTTFAAALAAPLLVSVAVAQTAAPAPAPAPAHPAGHAAPAPAPAPRPATTVAQAQPPFVIPFTRGGTSVNSDMTPMLDRVVAYAQANRNTGLTITGIADARGSDSARASRARAMATSIRNALRDRGIPESRTRTAAEGDAAATAVNRVEVTFQPLR